MREGRDEEGGGRRDVKEGWGLKQTHIRTPLSLPASLGA